MTGNTIKNEILSPAGSMDTLYAGIAAGADAVYIGGQLFGARAYAENPDNSNLLKAIDYVHLHDKKLYLTVNTLLKNSEIEEQLYQYLLPLYRQGLDAVIVQDLGVFNFIKENFEGLDIHASTQMMITGTDGAALLKKMGASRIVTARELSLAELKEIHNQVDIEIESFIHGAMCYSYSGICLFSSMVGGRSGNRGRCAGPCRQPYEVYKNAKRINDNHHLYALSLKDMNTLEILPDIIESGVFSLKIEGRMKSPEYAAGVVSIYRKYLDLYNEKGRDDYQLEQKDIQNLSELYSRGGSVTGYYKCHNAKNMISFYKPAYKSDNDCFVSEIKETYCNKLLKKKASANIILKLHKPMTLEINLPSESGNISISADGEIVENALKRPIDASNVYKQINKTGDSFLEFEHIEIHMDDNIFVPVSHLNELRRDAVTKLEKHLLEKYKRSIPTEKKKYIPKPYPEKEVTISCQVHTRKQLACALKKSEISTIYLSTDIFTVEECINAVEEVMLNDKECCILLPFIYRAHAKKYVSSLITGLHFLVENKNFALPVLVARNVDELEMILKNGYKNFRIDNSLYSFNQYAKECFYSLNADRITLPYELNFNELKHLADSRDELVIYGRIPLMVTAGCVRKNFDQCHQEKNEMIELKDRKSATFVSLCCCNFCYNIIYNCVPLSLLGVKEKVSKINTKNYRINLTLEDDKNAMEIIEKCIKIFYYNEYSQETFQFTRGHFNRGVE